MRLVCYGRMGAVSLVLVACLFTWGRTAHGDYSYGEPTKVPNVSRPGAAGPRISPDGLELYFAYSVENECQDLWVARRSTTREPWGAPVRLDPPVNSAAPVDNACISADGLELYFAEGHPAHYTGRGGDCVPNPSGYGGGDLWVSSRVTRKDPWGNPQNLGPTVNTARWEDQPSLSTDGLSLYFTSDRAGGELGDLYVTTRPTKNVPWGPAAPVAGINMYGEFTPFISPDGLSLFFAKGGWAPDIYVSRRVTTDAPWATPVPFMPVNSNLAEYHLSFSTNDSTLYFLRGDNAYGPFDLWQVKVLPIVDFNSDGKVDGKDVLVMAEHWGQNYPLCDIGPFAWGDGIVDGQDLMVLAQYMVDHSSDVNGAP